MWCVTFDDVSCYHPAKVQGIDPTIEEMIQVINPTPFVPDQAALEAKGRTPARPELVLGSTNTKTLNANMYYSHAPAVQRRMPWVITLKVKKQYAMEDGRLDSSKVPRNNNGYPDYWDITVEEVKTIPVQKGISSNAPYMPITFENQEMKNVSMGLFLQWYKSTIVRHQANQEGMVHAVSNIRETAFCDCCALPENLCLTLQATDYMTTFERTTYLTATWMLIVYLFLHISSFLTRIFALHYVWSCYNSIIVRFVNIRNYLVNGSHRLTPTKRNFRELGHMVQTRIGHPYVLLALGTFVALSTTVYKLSKRVMTLQGNNFSKPVPHTKERTNVWYNRGEMSNFSIPDHSKCATNEDVVDKVSKNTFKFFCQNPNDYKSGSKEGKGGYMMGVKGHLFVCNNHTIPSGDFILRLTKAKVFNTQGITSDRTFLVTQDQVQRFSEHDLAYLTLPQVSPVKDISKYVADESLDSRAPCSIVNTTQIRQLPMISRSNGSTLPLDDYDRVAVWYGRAATPTHDGDCGSPYVHFSPSGAQVIGLHVAGENGVVAAVPLRKQILLDLVAKEVIEAGTPNIQSISAPRQLRSLDVKSPIRYIEEAGSLNILGSFVGFRNQPKTTVNISPLAPILEKFGFVQTHTKPVMSGWVPKRTTLQELVHPPQLFRHDIIQKVRNSFLKEILAVLPQSQIHELRPYDLFTAINGAEGVSYVDSINRATSAGNPWKMSKKHFLKPIAPRGGLTDPVTFDDEILNRIDDFIKVYSTGKRNMPNFCAHLKDEPVSFKKAKIGKTRVFAGAPVDFSIVVRQYYLPLVRLMQNNRFAFESGPGTISQSKEWGDIYRYLTQYGTQNMVAGDFKMFDKSMPSHMILSAFWILQEIAKHGGYTPEDVTIMKGIAEDTAFSLIDYFGDLIETFSFNPSGHPLTVIINGLVNSMYMRYAYFVNNPEKECDSFKRNVNLFTYGDDNCMGVSDTVPWFNHTSIASSLREAGITYTMADKEAESVPYISIDEVSFLKRTWRFAPELGDYAAPLELDSIQKSLMIWTYSKTVAPPEQGVAVISSAIREYFFHGREIFDKMTKILIEVVDELEWNAYVTNTTFPTWDSLVSQWHDASRNLRED